MPKVVRIQISHKTKPMWAIEYDNGKKHGEYRDSDGFVRFQAWDRKTSAVRVLNLIKSGAIIELFDPNQNHD